MTAAVASSLLYARTCTSTAVLRYGIDPPGNTTFAADAARAPKRAGNPQAKIKKVIPVVEKEAQM